MNDVMQQGFYILCCQDVCYYRGCTILPFICFPLTAKAYIIGKNGFLSGACRENASLKINQEYLQ